jgi:hypothetical protein
MKLRVGYELRYYFPQPSPIIMMLIIHYTRVSDLERPDPIAIDPSVPISGYRDSLGNWCSRILAQPERCASRPTRSQLTSAVALATRFSVHPLRFPLSQTRWPI